MINGASHAINNRDFPCRLYPDIRVHCSSRYIRGRKQGVWRDEMSALQRMVSLRRLQVSMRHRMERQFSRSCQSHELAGKAPVELVALHQETQHRTIRDSQGNHGFVDLGKPCIAGDGGRQFLWLEGVTYRQGERASYRFGSVGLASRLPPGQVLLDTLAPGVTDRLLGVSARSVDGHAVE